MRNTPIARPTGKVWRIKCRDENGRPRDFGEALELATKMPWWSLALRYLGNSGSYFVWSQPDSIPVGCRGSACACGRCL